jgi:hypothetical protein
MKPNLNFIRRIPYNLYLRYYCATYLQADSWLTMQPSNRLQLLEGQKRGIYPSLVVCIHHVTVTEKKKGVGTGGGTCIIFPGKG